MEVMKWFEKDYENRKRKKLKEQIKDWTHKKIVPKMFKIDEEKYKKLWFTENNLIALRLWWVIYWPAWRPYQ